MRKIFVLSSMLSAFLLSRSALAHCPLCTAATGTLVATSRIAGLDDVITGTFLGAFAVSTAFWTARVVSSKLKQESRFSMVVHPYILTVMSLVLTVLGLQLSGVLNAFSPQIFGVDKLLFGTALGTAVSAASFELHTMIRAFNGGRNRIPFQGAVLPLSILAAVDTLLYVSGVLA